VNSLLTRLAFWWLARQMRSDEGYAWSWHCNLAMAAYDEGLEHHAANRAAARFMDSAFNINTMRLEQCAFLFPNQKKS
jgi:hypothetical protein